MDKRRMCPHCRAFITTDDRTCPYCGETTGPRYVERQPGALIGGWIPQAHFTTILILLINTGLYFATSWLSSGANPNLVLLAFGAKFGPSIFQGHEWWRLVTAGFLHGNLLHIVMNSWALYQLGAQVEGIYGTPRYLTIYFLSTVGGFWMSAEVSPRTLSIGSSAGIAGMIGMMIAFGVANRSTVGRAIRNFYLQSVVYILAIGFLGGFQIDNWAHIGGLAVGFGVGYVAGTPVHSSREREAMWRTMAAACVLVTVACFLEVYRYFPPLDQLR